MKSGSNLKTLRTLIYLILFIVVFFQLISCNGKKSSNSVVQEITPQKKDNYNIKVDKSLTRYFTDHKVQGSILIYDSANRLFTTNDSVDIYKETFPASTFKIINLLIALETQVISSEQDIIHWTGRIPDTSLYGYRPDIYYDMSVKHAFTVSAGWVFAELARRIGEEKYRKYLKLCRYGNQEYSTQGFEFWNFGPLQISPFNQVLFLQEIHKGTLPFSKRNLDILKNIMISKKGPDYVVRSKTGWTRRENTEIGWWVGYVEKRDNLFFFATRITQPFNKERSYDSRFGRYRKEITEDVFKHLKLIN